MSAVHCKPNQEADEEEDDDEKDSVSSENKERRSSSDVAIASLPVAPDGGWGWMVVVGAFFSMVLLDGVMFSFGVFFLELQSYFGESKGRTAFVGSALMGNSLLMGPVVSVLVNMVGIRAVAMSGAVLCASAFAISTLAPSITVLTITYGFLGGLGVCMVYLPSIIAVGFYFEKKRALANGITSSGSGIGTFIYSPMCNSLQTEYGWKGALLIISAITLNCLACGALYLPVSHATNRKKSRAKVRKYNGVSAGSDGCKYGGVMENLAKDEDAALLNKATLENPYLQALRVGSKSRSYHDMTEGSVHTQKENGSISNKPLVMESTQSLDQKPSVYVSLTHRQMPKPSARPIGQAPHSVSCYAMQTSSTVSQDLLNRPLSRKDIFYSGSLQRLPEYQTGHTSSLYHLDAAGKPAVEQLDGSCLLQIHQVTSKWEDIKRSFLRVTGLRLMKNPAFLLCMISFVFWTTHSTILTLLPDYATQQPGVTTSQAALLLSIIGATNTAARIVAGWISDMPKVSCIWVNVAALFVGGACCVAMAFTHLYWLLAVETGVFGLCMGTWTSLRPIILVELLGLDNLTNAFGLVALFQGLAFSVGPPIAGAFCEYTASYFGPFIVAGAAFITSGALCVLMRKVASSACGDVDAHGRAVPEAV